MLLKVKVVCLNILIIVCLIRSIKGNCRVEVPLDHSLRPSVYLNFGSHKLKINSFSGNYLELHENQNIEAYCNVNFIRPESYDSSNMLYIKCFENSLYVSRTSHQSNHDYYSYKTLFECSSLKLNLYESSHNFHWCPSNVTSYILARASHPSLLMKQFNYLAGICYDIYSPAIYSIYYTVAPKKAENMHPSVFGNLYRAGVQLNYISETFGFNEISPNDFDNDFFRNWITTSNYDFHSIIQHSKLYSTYNDQFSSLLELLWWPNLRLFNWKSYLTALDEHVQNDNQTYDILAGVSGAIKAPIPDGCKTNYTMNELVFKTDRQIPLYVWNYLQNRDNSSNEIVIIGFNSPFNEFYSEDDIIFCPDKCQEIPWLKKVTSYFRYSVMGIVFCCNVEDVRSSNRLNGFPEIDMELKLVEVPKFPPVLNYVVDEV